ncbi:hypothetical protein [Nonomuraea dietziae]|uniref:hypothetical protein n=1 Tax=Nonomuraea dietziae TaxID=65515 RepID=UPI0033E1947D
MSVYWEWTKHHVGPYRGRSTLGDPVNRVVRRGGPASALLSRFQHPTQVITTGFAAVLVGAALLSLLPASGSGEPTNWIAALFTTTSAVCVTGLAIVDTG